MQYNTTTLKRLFPVFSDLAARAKKLACRLHYDCSVIVRTENIIGAATRFFPFVVGACTRMKNEGEGPVLS